jgi:hypothetical protein
MPRRQIKVKQCMDCNKAYSGQVQLEPGHPLLEVALNYERKKRKHISHGICTPCTLKRDGEWLTGVER